jgi:DNA-binding CsgD family transcriptional regulator
MNTAWQTSGQSGMPHEPRRGRPPSLADFGLTARESEVLGLAAQGKTNFQIARMLGNSEGTVRNQMSAVLRKLGAKNRSEATVMAVRLDCVVDRRVERAARSGPDLDALLPYMRHRRLEAGTVVFRRGDAADELYYLQQGTVRLEELGIEVPEHGLFGEIGLFAPRHVRTCTAVAATAVDLFSVTSERAHQLTYLNPAFAWLVLRLVTERLMADRERFAAGTALPR